MQAIRRAERTSSYIMVVALALMCCAFTAAAGAQPSQAEINGRYDERLNASMERIQKLETAQQYSMGALVANFAAHLFQIKANGRRRRLERQSSEDQDE